MSIDYKNKNLKLSGKQLSKKNNQDSQAYFLGIDFGLSKIGLALAPDDAIKMAFSWQILKNDEHLLLNLKEIIQEYNIQKIIIGQSGKNLVEEIESFKQKLKTNFQGEIFLVDEMFTTKIAQIWLKEKQAKNIGKKDDALAAQVILQSWLDKNSFE